MDQEELEKDGQVKEFMRTRERQHAGLDRHFRGPDGFGWFSQDPDLISPNWLQRGKFRVREVDDLSNHETFVEGEEYKLALGSFSIEMNYGRLGIRGGGIYF